MLSQTAEYALRAAVCLGQNEDQPLTTQQIAQQTKVPPSYLSKILGALAREGLVSGRRGIGGGYQLSKPLDKLTVLDVVNAVDPIQRIERCPLDLPEHATALCPLHRRIDQAIAMVEALFDKCTLAQLLREAAKAPHFPTCPRRKAAGRK